MYSNRLEGFPELEPKKREALFRRGQSTLLLVHHQSKSHKLALETFPRLLGLWFRTRQQHHIVRIAYQHDKIAHLAVTVTPLTIHLVKDDVGKQRRNDSLNAKDNLGSALIW